MAIEKKNIFLNTDFREQMAYKASSAPINTKYPERDYARHAKRIEREYDTFVKQVLTQKQVAAIKLKGMYAEFSGQKDFELDTQQLENRPAGIRLLNIREVDGVTKATVYIPEGKEDFFRERINAYANDKTKKGKPKYQDLIGSIENIKQAMLDSFWTDKIEIMPEDIPIKCEIWLRYDISTSETNKCDEVEQEFHNICANLHITVDKEKRLLFPERIIKLVRANKSELIELLANCEYITEMRRAEEPTSFFTHQSKTGQQEWADDLLKRCKFNDTNTSICLLDAGINEDNKLLTPAILQDGVHAVDDAWSKKDSPLYGGHGTEMAGVAVYGDLQDALATQDLIMVNHKIESVKILPDKGTNDSDLYGAITQNAVLTAEIDNPVENRVLCMAVTADNESYRDGRPSSWSAAVDSSSSGAEEEAAHRLFVVSAGNIFPGEFKEGKYPDVNITSSVEDPAQAWNAITVGGYSGKIEIHDTDFKGFQALAPKDGLSPYSKTSTSWKRSWPIKPEVVFEGGNMATNGADYDSCDDLSLLTTGHRPYVNLFSTIWGTSSATAQAANFCAKLMAEYPEMWPETVRALMIHSADWTEEMKRQFLTNGDAANKTEKGSVLRTCGYGVPNLDKAIQCKNSAVNMVIQDTIQPFKKEKGSVKMNEMHIYSLPWPSDLLRKMGGAEVKIRVTLSYFVEPFPGEVGWKDRYKYRSCGLRFEINKPNQSLDEFKTQINKMARDEDNEVTSSSGSSNNWYYGTTNRNTGSVHSDFIAGNAVDLCESKYVAVYPVGGWWKDRPYLGKAENKVRYALVVTLSTPDVSIDLYTPIINEIHTAVPVQVPITAV